MLKNQLNFDPEKHEYTLDGVVLPSVTQLLPDQQFYCTPEQLENARQEGIENHSLIKMYWDSNEDTFGDPYLMRFKAWVNEVRPMLGQIMMYETPLASAKHKFAGTPDMIFENGIVDLKRSKPGRTVNLQLAGYSLLCRENKIRFIGKKRFLMAVWDNGNMFSYMNVPDARAEDVFMACIKKHYAENYINEYLRGNV